jgi:hypothetical protein
MAHTPSRAAPNPGFDAYPTRLALARETRLRGRATAHELALAVGKGSQGAIQGVLNHLTSISVLIRETEERRGQEVAVYWFNDEWGEELEAALARSSESRLAPGLRLIFVPAAGLAALADEMRDPLISNAVAWLADTDDSALGAILAIREEGLSSTATNLLVRLQRAGVSATRSRIASVVPSRDIERWVRDLTDGGSNAALSSAE